MLTFQEGSKEWKELKLEAIHKFTLCSWYIISKYCAIFVCSSQKSPNFPVRGPHRRSNSSRGLSTHSRFTQKNQNRNVVFNFRFYLTKKVSTARMRTLREPHQRFAVPWPKPTISCFQIIGRPSLFEEESVLGQIASNNLLYFHHLVQFSTLA